MTRTLTFCAAALLLVGCATHSPEGTYEGTIISEKATPVYTTFYSKAVSQKENINGLFTYKENQEWITGTLSDCRFTENQNASCHWKDKYGVGIMQIQFSENYDAFKGNWGSYCGIQDELTWDGAKTQNQPQQ